MAPDPMKMPLEIVLNILNCLPIADPFRLRRVSKSWQETLSSPEAVQQDIKNWDTMELLEGEDLDRLQVIKHHHMARPARSWIFSSRIDQAILKTGLIKLHKHHIACMISTNNRVAVLCIIDLKDRSMRKYRPIHNVGHDAITHILFADKLAGFIVRNLLYWTDRDEQILRSKHFPWLPDAAAAHRSTVVAITSYRQGCIWIYDSVTEQETLSRIGIPIRQNLDIHFRHAKYGIIMDDKHITVFFMSMSGVDTWSKTPFSISIQLLTINGIHIHTKTYGLSHSNLPTRTLPNYLEVSETGQPNLYRISTIIGGLDNWQELVHVDEGIIGLPSYATSGTYWKGSLYAPSRPASFNSPARISTYRHKLGWQQQGRLQWLATPQRAATRILVNDHYLISLNQRCDDYSVWYWHMFCFDPKDPRGRYLIKRGNTGAWVWEASNEETGQGSSSLQA